MPCSTSAKHDNASFHFLDDTLIHTHLTRNSHEHSVDTDIFFVKPDQFLLQTIVVILTKYSPKVSQCNAISFNILPINIEHYDLQVKTSKLTPPELIKNSG